MIVRRLAAIGALCLGALGAPGMIAPASGAAFEWDYVSSHTWYQPISNCAMKSFPHPAIACFEHDGDWLDVGDLALDKMRAGMQWRTDYGRAGICVNTHGVDANYPFGGSSQGEHACNKNFDEGSLIQFRAGRCDGSEVNCGVLGNWQDWSAWSPKYRI
jgi:hypothetical protein